MAIANEILDAAKKASGQISGDVFLYNGPIEHGRDLRFIEEVYKTKRSNNATLFLTTHGGDPDAAYKMARYLQDKYERFSIVISGKCKSAGTLIAVGASELVFTPYGELGPLDIQLTKVDKFDQLQSGLAIQDALNTLEQRALDKFFTVTKNWIDANQGLLSFATATKSAADFIAQLYAPIFARIDPEEVGARTRSMRIAIDYGKRLALKSQNLKQNTLLQLAEKYSSHSFVIDMREAEILFNKVRAATAAETAVVDAIGSYGRFETPTLAECGCYALHDTNIELNEKTDGEKNGKADGPRTSAADGGDSPRGNGKAVPKANGAKRRRATRPTASL